jgi:HEAT repeat protein
MMHFGDIHSLIEQGVARGLSDARLQASLKTLRPIVDSLGFGEQPHYDQLDPAKLKALEPEMGFIIRSLAKSPAADLKTAAYHLIGVLDSTSLMPLLRAGVESAQEWERVEAVRALARMSSPEARTILLSATGHSDPQTRRAAEGALE